MMMKNAGTHEKCLNPPCKWSKPEIAAFQRLKQEAQPRLYNREKTKINKQEI